MVLVDSAIPIPSLPQVGTKPKAQGPRQARSKQTVTNLLQVGVNPAAQILPLESQTLKDVDTWSGIYGKRPGSRTAKAAAILTMISAFHAFCQEYVAELSNLADSAPHNWLDSAVDNVLLDYWEPILRAAEQNRSAHYRTLFEKGYAKLDLLQGELEKRLKFKMDVNIVLYFEKIGKAKRYPFGNTYLIGIPLIDAYRDDWMAIPHELGHHIFWNARFSDEDKTILPMRGTNFLQEEINDAMRKLELAQDDPARKSIQKILDDWTEEIFADVVGSRIAGKEFVTAAWSRISRKVDEKKNLFLSDGQHPVPYLLPYIRASAAKIDLEDKWKDFFGDIEYTQLVSDKSIEKQYQDPPIQIKDLLYVVQVYAENITARLKKIKIDQLIQGPSSVAELKDFVRLSKKGASRSNLSNSENEEKEVLRSLLNPVILERGEGWTCRKNHPNDGDRDFCQTCGLAHHWWNYVPFL